jgi:hypothetical protein
MTDIKEKLNLLTEFEFVDEQSINPDVKEAFSAINLNPAVTWAKFVLTDDKPNKNRQRVPEEEFDNLIKTGVYMPIKMAQGSISEGHEGTFPIGAIAFLRKVKSQVLGLAALWDKERPEDVQLIRDYYKEGKPLQLSWEINFSESSMSDENVEELRGTSLRAVTLVGMPAYAGRTPIIALASEQIDKLPDECFFFVEDGEKDSEGKTTPRSLRHFPYKNAEGSVDFSKIKEIVEKVPNTILKDGSKISDAVASKLLEDAKVILSQNSSLEDNKLEELEKALSKVADLEKEIKTKDEAFSAQSETLKTLQDSLKELDELREYKKGIEGEKEVADKIAKIKTKFSGANLNKDEKYFEDNKEKLLAMTDDSLDWMIQELVSFASANKPANSSLNVPPFNSSSNKVDVKALVAELKSSKE